MSNKGNEMDPIVLTVEPDQVKWKGTLGQYNWRIDKYEGRSEWYQVCIMAGNLTLLIRMRNTLAECQKILNDEREKLEKN